MFINEVPNGAELSSIIINELRDMYGVKYRKDKKLKDQSVNIFLEIRFLMREIGKVKILFFFLIRMLVFGEYSVCH